MKPGRVDAVRGPTRHAARNAGPPQVAAGSIALGLLAFLAAWPVLRAGMPTGGDGLIHFYRLVELDWALRNGVLFPRWMPDLGYGFGMPLFVYYPPLTYYAAALLRLAGLSFAHATLAIYALALALAALGAYAWGRAAFGEAGGWVAGAAYSFAPYLYLDALARGALPETLALGLLPWVFWAYGRLAARPSRGAFAAAVLLFTALILTHTITALVSAPLLAACVLYRYLASHPLAHLPLVPPQAATKGNPSSLLIALALSLFLSAFFWLPALLEIGYVQAGQLFIPALDFRNHFLSLGRLLAAPRPFDPRLVYFEFPASLAWPQAALALIGLGAAVRGLQRPETAGKAAHTLFLWGALLGLCFLTLPLSLGLWERLPLLRYVQFPWRLVGPASLLLAGAAAAGAQALRGWPGARQVSGWIVPASVLACWGFSLPWTFTAGYARLADPGVAGIARYEIETGQLGTTAAGEYLPRAVAELPPPEALAGRYAQSPIIARLNRAALPSGATVLAETAHLQHASATIDSPEAFAAVFDWFFYPGWRAEVDGQPAAAGPHGPHGLIGVEVPAGQHTVAVRFGATPLRQAAGAISAAGALALAGVLLRWPALRAAASSPAPRARRRLSTLPAALLLALLVARAAYLDRFPNPFSYSRFDGATVKGLALALNVNFDDRLVLLGADLAQAQVASGETLRLDLFWRPRAAPLDANYSVSAHLIDEAGFRFGQADAQHPGGLPTSRWLGDQYALDRHMVRVLPGTPPGVYHVVVGVYRPDTGATLSVRDAAGNPQGSSVTAAEVTVTRANRPASDLELAPSIPLHQMLGPLTLVGHDLDPGPLGAQAGGPIYLTLYWRAREPLVNTQPLRVQLEIVAGATVLASEAAPPGGPDFPTPQWAAGEAVRRPHALRLPATAAPGPAAVRVSLLNEAGVVIAGPVTLAEIDIHAPERATSRPHIPHPLTLEFGDNIRLLGYALEPLDPAPGEALRLTLYWEALGPVGGDYTVFTHLLDEQGRIRGQHDGLPASGARPTTGWLPGEVVTDPHELTLAAGAPLGDYTIAVGLYEAASGARLPVLGPDGHPVGDQAVLARVEGEDQ